MMVKSLFYTFLSQFFEMFSSLLKLNANSIVFNSVGNTEYNFNSKYLFEYYLKEVGRDRVYFVINDKEKAIKLKKEIGDYFISAYTFRGLITIAFSKVWVCSGLNTPYFVVPVFRNKRRVVYHIGHGIPLKKMGLSEEKITSIKWLNRYIRTRAFTHVLSFSPKIDDVMSSVFKNKKISFVHLGQPRNDTLSYSDKLCSIYNLFPNLKKGSEFILYAPTWRNYSKTVFFPYDDIKADELNKILVSNNKYLFLRGHPYYESEIDECYLEQSNIIIFSYEKFPEVMEYLPAFDKLITDYSSIYLDYLLLDRPVAFLPYDIDEYIYFTGFAFDYNLITPGEKLLNSEGLVEFILNGDSYGSERNKIKQLFNMKSSNNCYDNYCFISNVKGD